MSDPRPIGVFDSGVGGLTVAAALQRRLPRERLLYLGDTVRLPYGTKSAATVRRYKTRPVNVRLTPYLAPHMLIEMDGTVFTSVMLFLRKR